MHRATATENPLALPASSIPSGSRRTFKSQALRCQACPLWKTATQTVFGKGSRIAKLILVGEQPGNREDIAGIAFTGSAATLLKRAMETGHLASLGYFACKRSCNRRRHVSSTRA